MPTSNLHSTLSRLSKLRKADSYVCYLTAEKQPTDLFGTAIAVDVVPLLDDHLVEIKKVKKLLLVLNTSGGSLEAPWPIVSQLREYCDQLEVIVLKKALSAGTLISLGADTILMNTASFLSPIDPQGKILTQNGQMDIQVEDVTAFIDFVKQKVGINDPASLAEVTKVLSQQIQPSTLGSIYRAHSLVRMLAEKLLRLHKKKLDDVQIKNIISHLTEKLFSHQHLISRREAKDDLGLKDIIVYATDEEEKVIRAIYKEYEKVLQLDSTFMPDQFLGKKDQSSFTLERAIIESATVRHAYTTEYNITRNTGGEPKPFDIRVNDLGWIKSKEDSKK